MQNVQDPPRDGEQRSYHMPLAFANQDFASWCGRHFGELEGNPPLLDESPGAVDGCCQDGGHGVGFMFSVGSALMEGHELLPWSGPIFHEPRGMPGPLIIFYSDECGWWANFDLKVGCDDTVAVSIEGHARPWRGAGHVGPSFIGRAWPFLG